MGEELDLKRCDNRRCFLYHPILSVNDLDAMDHLGAEHELPGLTEMGFEPADADPTGVQQVVKHPQ